MCDYHYILSNNRILILDIRCPITHTSKIIPLPHNNWGRPEQAPYKWYFNVHNIYMYVWYICHTK